MTDKPHNAATLLALDTTGDACSVALSVAPGQVVTRELTTPRQHAPRLLGLIEEVLAEAGIGVSALDAICFAAGPGSFTGLRIATGVAQGLAFGAQVPVIAVSSLATLAQGQIRERGASGQAIDQMAIIACFDARMSQLYWGCYAADADGVVQPLIDDTLSDAASVSLPSAAPGGADARVWCGASSGLQAAPDLADRLGLAQCAPDALPMALDVLQLAQPQWTLGAGRAPGEVTPVYLRDQVTHTRAT